MNPGEPRGDTPKNILSIYKMEVPKATTIKISDTMTVAICPECRDFHIHENAVVGSRVKSACSDKEYTIDKPHNAIQVQRGLYLRIRNLIGKQIYYEKNKQKRQAEAEAENKGITSDVSYA